MIDAIIIAGGKGSRIQHILKDRPKPMVLINDSPFLNLLVRQLHSFNIKKIILAIGYMADFFVQYYQNDPLISFSIEDKPLNTGGAIKKALPLTSTDHVLALNADFYIEYNFEKFYNAHIQKNADCTLLYTDCNEIEKYGTLSIDPKTNRVLSMREKSLIAKKGFMNGGTYLMKKDLFDACNFPESFSIELDGFPKLLSLKKIYSFYTSSPYFDIGSKETHFENIEKLKKYYL